MSELSPTWETTESFGQSWPIPFRVLWLSFMTLVGFATNLHLLAFLGIDTSLVLDIRLDSGVGAPVSHLPRAAAPFVHPSRLYPPLYSLAALGLAWTAIGWSVFMKLTGGDPIEMVRWRGVPAFVALMVGAVSIAPVNIMYRKQRFMFLRSVASPIHVAFEQRLLMHIVRLQSAQTHHFLATLLSGPLLRHHSRRYSHLERQSARRRLGFGLPSFHHDQAVRYRRIGGVG